MTRRRVIASALARLLTVRPEPSTGQTFAPSEEANSLTTLAPAEVLPPAPLAAPRPLISISAKKLFELTLVIRDIQAMSSDISTASGRARITKLGVLARATLSVTETPRFWSLLTRERAARRAGLELKVERLAPVKPALIESPESGPIQGLVA